MTPDVWAARNRSYPKSAAISGPRDPLLTPYIIPIEHAIANCTSKRIVCVFGAQTGKTELLLDCAGARLDQHPAPILYVGPNKQFLNEQFEPRVMALLDSAPTLADKVARGKRMTKTRKLIAGVPFRLAHAGSSAALKSDPAALALVDEYDEMLANVRGQGDPLGLVERRGDTYPDFVAVVTSTCKRGVVETYTDTTTGLEFWAEANTDDIKESPIWGLWQQGTRYHWAWPCPHCKDYFIPRFDRARWPEGATAVEAVRSTHIECPRCGGIIEEKDKTNLNAHGRFVAPGQTINREGVVTGSPRAAFALSYWVSGFCSPFVTFGDRIQNYLESKESGDPDRIQTSVNAGFGELYMPRFGKVPPWQEVGNHRIQYGKTDLPDGVVHTVMTVDVQKNRLIYVVRGWGARATSWLVDYGEFHGETTYPEVWAALADYISSNPCGRPLRMVLIDSGYRPGKMADLPVNRVYEFCHRFPNCRPAKGASSPMAQPIKVGALDIRISGKPIRYGLQQVLINTDYFKSWVHERLHWPLFDESGKPLLGAWHLPRDADENYLRQIVSESREVLANGKPVWIEHSRQNHYLDLESMQAAAAHLLNMSSLSPMAANRQTAEIIIRASQPPPPNKGNGIASRLAR